MDLSKRVEVLHPQDIVMYMRGIYRFVHLSAMSKENLFIPISPLSSQRLTLFRLCRFKLLYRIGRTQAI